MAEAQDRSMVGEFRQGCIDNSYIQVAPNVGGLVEMGWRVDKAMTLPQYLSAERRMEDPFDTVRRHKASQPIEVTTRYTPRRDRVQVF